jgi:hypothetical protein
MCHQHQTITKMLSDTPFIGLDPNGAAITKRTRGVRHGLDRCQHVMQHERFVHFEPKVALGFRKYDSVAVPKNLDCDHRERLALSRIDLLFIGLDPNGAAISKRTRGVRQELDRCQRVTQHGGLVNIELRVALGARKCDRVAVAKNLDCDHRERLALSRRVPASAKTSTNRSAILSS